MIDYKKTTAPNNTITRDMNELTEKVGNVYETVAILGKRSNQISISRKVGNKSHYREVHNKGLWHIEGEGRKHKEGEADRKGITSYVAN